ncbi:hypothetical protein F5Y15DRAFT_397096 [Xylariaceae sp. FL0016]|nr:hypothetical protein F5Y15DRAFT_397096 [Xylariaceae sp. FL0016]
MASPAPTKEDKYIGSGQTYREGDTGLPSYEESQPGLSSTAANSHIGELDGTSVPRQFAAELDGTSAPHAYMAEMDGTPAPHPQTAELAGSEASSYPAPYSQTAALTGTEASSHPSAAAARFKTSGRGTPVGPTVESPFNFPPPYTATAGDPSASPGAPPRFSSTPSGSSSLSGQGQSQGRGQAVLQRPIVIPQVKAEAASPFLDAYTPVLLAFGFPQTSFRNFVATLSAFLSAKVGDRAVAHAGDMASQFGRHVAGAPKAFGLEAKASAKRLGKNIAHDAKTFNLPGLVLGGIFGAVGLVAGTAVGAVGAVLSPVGAGFGAVSARPKTPLERAVAYVAVADRDWFHPRGLHVDLFETDGLASLLPGQSGKQIVEGMRAAKKGDAGAQMKVLGEAAETLDIPVPVKLDVGLKTLWLAIEPWTAEQREEELAQQRSKGKGKGKA